MKFSNISFQNLLLHNFKNCCTIYLRRAIAPYLIFKGTLMRVLSIHANQNYQSQRLRVFGQKFSNNSVSKLNQLNQNDVFVRLAAASTKDARIEKELNDMGLI